MRAEIRAFAVAVGDVVRRVAGMPDYEAYVAHLRRCHPGRAVPSEREYYEDYVANRYGDGPTRCC
jgi:uncharacterized short protein YbdD (DUF466 family)